MAAPSKEQKESVKKRDGYTCQAGGLFFPDFACTAPLTVHHRLPREWRQKGQRR
jgi:hypothetical protein